MSLLKKINKLASKTINLITLAVLADATLKAMMCLMVVNKEDLAGRIGNAYGIIQDLHMVEMDFIDAHSGIEGIRFSLGLHHQCYLEVAAAFQRAADLSVIDQTTASVAAFELAAVADRLGASRIKTSQVRHQALKKNREDFVAHTFN